MPVNQQQLVRFRALKHVQDMLAESAAELERPAPGTRLDTYGDLQAIIEALEEEE